MRGIARGCWPRRKAIRSISRACLMAAPGTTRPARVLRNKTVAGWEVAGRPRGWAAARRERYCRRFGFKRRHQALRAGGAGRRCRGRHRRVCRCGPVRASGWSGESSRPQTSFARSMPQRSLYSHDWQRQARTEWRVSTIEPMKLEELDHLNQSARQVLDQLVWWTKALKVARDNDVADRRDQGRLRPASCQAGYPCSVGDWRNPRRRRTSPRSYGEKIPAGR